VVWTNDYGDVHSVKVEPDGEAFYIASGSSLKRVLANGTVDWSVNLGSTAYRVDYKDNYAYVSTDGATYSYDTLGQQRWSQTGMTGYVKGLTVENGSLYAGEFSTGRFWSLELSSGNITTNVSTSGTGKIQKLDGENGLLYASGQGAIDVYDSSGALQQSYNNSGAGEGLEVAYDEMFVGGWSGDYHWVDRKTLNVNAQVTLNDGWNYNDVSIVESSWANSAPTADSGGPYSGYEGDSVTLDGTNSSDPDGDSLTYTWDIEDFDASGNNETATGATPSLSLTGANSGTYNVTLTVDDGSATSTSYTTLEVKENGVPTADAGGPYEAVLPGDGSGVEVTFNASGSSDPDGQNLTYTWDLDGDGAYDDSSSETFTWNYVNATEQSVSVRVTDGTNNDTANASVRVTEAPTADAGADFGAEQFDDFVLDATASSDPDGDSLTYSWAVTSKPTGANVTFPEGKSNASVLANADTSGNYTFEVTVDDGIATSTDTVNVTMDANDAPTITADATPNPVELSNVSSLTATVGDPEGDTLTYSWTVTSKPDNSSVNITDASALSPDATFDKVGNYTLELTATDTHGASSNDSIVVEVVKDSTDSTSDSTDDSTDDGTFWGSGGGSCSAHSLLTDLMSGCAGGMSTVFIVLLGGPLIIFLALGELGRRFESQDWTNVLFFMGPAAGVVGVFAETSAWIQGHMWSLVKYGYDRLPVLGGFVAGAVGSGGKKASSKGGDLLPKVTGLIAGAGDVVRDGLYWIADRLPVVGSAIGKGLGMLYRGIKKVVNSVISAIR
jgi:hypothetical protein